MKKSWKKPDEKSAQPGKDLEPRFDPVNQVAGRGTTATARRDAHQVVVSEQNFKGPLPPPELLRQYQQIMPNLPEIIVQRMMDEMNHRQEMERRHMAMCEGWATGDLQLQRRGQFFGFILGFVGIAGGLGVAAFVSPAGGAIVSGISLTAIVIAFLKRRTESDKDEKDEAKHDDKGK
jgi:uncharacterized membrane protein